MLTYSTSLGAHTITYIKTRGDVPLLLSYFHLHQLHDLRKDLDGVGVGDERVHPPAIHDGGGHGLQHVSAQVHLLQLLQLGHFTEE